MNYDKIIRLAIKGKGHLQEQTKLYDMIGSNQLNDEADAILLAETEVLEKKIYRIGCQIRGCVS